MHRVGDAVHTALRISAVVVTIVMVTLVFQAPQARATNPTVPVDGNAALASGGASASATSQTSGYEASKAIDGSSGTAWISASTTPTFTVTFAAKYYILEVHVHMASISGTDPVASVAQPDIDFYVDTEGTGTWSLVKSIRGNANLDLVVSFATATPAKQIQLRFLTPVTHTHEKTTTRCVDWAYDEYTGRRLGCIEYSTVTTTYTDTHPPRVNELEAWGNLYDWDGDGLSNGFEESVIYRQDAVVTGLPLSIPDNGEDVLVLALERPVWSGVGTRAFLDLELDHPSPGDLAVAIGSWDGAAWQDRLVWVPGEYAGASIWDTIGISYSYTAPGCERHWDPENGVYYCVTVMMTYTGTNYYTGRPVAAQTGESHVLSSDLIPSAYIASVSSMPWHVRIDLSDPTLESVESSAGFRAPALTATELHSRGMWRILVRDWNPEAGAGNLRSASIRTEERTDPHSWDTDSDNVLSDAVEVGPGLGTFPVAIDTDFDGLSDVFEKDPQYLSWTIDGVPRSESVKTDPVLADSDGDGLSDYEERYMGSDGVVTDPRNPDSDLDGLWDGFTTGVHLGEASYYADPARSDTDGDTFSDGIEVSPRTLSLTVNGVGVTRSVTLLPYAADSDGDGLSDNQEWYGTSPYGVVTDPSDADTDNDGLEDGREGWTVYAVTSLDQLESILTAIESLQPLEYYEHGILVTYYTTYAVQSSPIQADTDADGLTDYQEFFLRSNPLSGDTDGDHLPDASDADPTIIEIEKPLISVDAISDPEFFVDWQLKRYHVTYSSRDAAGLDRVLVYKDGNYDAPTVTHYANGATAAQYTDNFDVGWLDAFDGAKWEIAAWDVNGNADYITLQQPTVFDAVGNFLTSATVSTLGPTQGGQLSGGWYAFRDTVVDLATLFLDPGSIFDGGQAVADAFSTNGLQAIVDLGESLFEFIDASQIAANPYAESECTTNAGCNFNLFKYNWYAGYVGATLGLSWVGATAAKALVKGLKFAEIAGRIAEHLPDLSDATRIAQLVNRLKGIGILNSRVLLATIFTGAFAAAAYVWPEIFGEWFANYLGGAFVLMSVYNLSGLGLADDVMEKAGRVITRAAVSDVRSTVRSLVERLGVNEANRILRECFDVDLVKGYGRVARRVFVNSETGAIYEIRVAARKGAGAIERFGKAIPDGEIDILLRDGTIVEVKSGVFSNFKDELGRQIPNYHEWAKSQFGQAKPIEVWVLSSEYSATLSYIDSLRTKIPDLDISVHSLP